MKDKEYQPRLKKKKKKVLENTNKGMLLSAK